MALDFRPLVPKEFLYAVTDCIHSRYQDRRWSVRQAPQSVGSEFQLDNTRRKFLRVTASAGASSNGRPERPARRSPGRRLGSADDYTPVKKSRIGNEGEDPYRFVENTKVYLDELDVISLLNPPPFLRPMIRSNYNHAAFLWKKIGDIPEERRHRLLDLLLPQQISKMWTLSGLRYDNPDLFIEDAAGMLPNPSSKSDGKLSMWKGRQNVPWYLNPLSRFKKVFFVGSDKKLYGRAIVGGQLLKDVASRLYPLYFQVKKVDFVTATEESCDLAFEFGEGQLQLCDSLPMDFPQPEKHRRPFDDEVYGYVRAVGPGVMVGQSWVEGKELDKTPRKLFGEYIMVKCFEDNSTNIFSLIK